MKWKGGATCNGQGLRCSLIGACLTQSHCWLPVLQAALAPCWGAC
jgi:hypothetical protein